MRKKMRTVTLEDLLSDSVCRKHLPRASVDHLIRVAEIAVNLADHMSVDPDKAAKAGLLQDVGHEPTRPPAKKTAGQRLAWRSLLSPWKERFSGLQKGGLTFPLGQGCTVRER
jgi:hypothetical protein